MNTGDLPRGFSAKLWLDRLQPAAESLFLDADCLVMGPLDPIFVAFEGKPVGVFGDVLADGEWFGDVAGVCGRLNIPWMPRFNGGVYYITKGPLTTAVFSYARSLEGSYDLLGFVRLRGQPNEEVLISASLARHGIAPVLNDGRYYADFQWWPVVQRFNVSGGVCLMHNPAPGDPRHQPFYPAKEAAPAIVHFLGHHVGSVLYRRSALEILMYNKRIPAFKFLARAVFFHLEAWQLIKDVLRPVYRALFGPRAVRSDDKRYFANSPD